MEGLSIVDVFAIWCLRLLQEPSLATRTSPLITLGSMIEASWLLILRMNCLVRAAVVKFLETVEGRMMSSVARGRCERMMVCDHAWQWVVCLLSALYSPSIAAVWQGYRCRSDKSDFEDLRRTSPSAFDAVQLADSVQLTLYFVRSRKSIPNRIELGLAKTNNSKNLPNPSIPVQEACGPLHV